MSYDIHECLTVIDRQVAVVIVDIRIFIDCSLVAVVRRLLISADCGSYRPVISRGARVSPKYSMTPYIGKTIDDI